MVRILNMFGNLIIVGLLLDIVGAFVIAVPDFPELDRRFLFGRLRVGQDRMESGGLSRGDTGFDEMMSLLDRVKPVEDNGEKSDGIEEILVNSRGGMSGSEVYESDMNWGDEYVEARYGESAGFSNTAFYGPGEVYRLIRDETASQVTKVRGAGFLLLAGGFALQLIGTALGP